ncbi:polycomb group RING finger protein 1 isoform X2 [Lepidochelys kempii]|uniref:polycomb group RING finger protein 1 isoform X2 n=1 Tax=Lepidochelys kempii TaxID=8472 RepID=UPI003C702A50
MASPPQGGPMAIAMRLRNQLQAVYKMDPLRNEEVKVKMKELNEHIVCCLCAGYFIDATTITECLHTFCKSCIVKYLQTSKYCPMCNTKIHETQPLLNLKLDRVMQDVLYKLVPGLQESEEKRIREFYQSRGLDRVTQPSSEDPVVDTMGLPYSSFDHSRAHYYRFDEHVSLCLERQSSSKEKNKTGLQVRPGRGWLPACADMVPSAGSRGHHEPAWLPRGRWGQHAGGRGPVFPAFSQPSGSRPVRTLAPLSQVLVPQLARAWLSPQLSGSLAGVGLGA